VRIGIDARELCGKPTGVGRYLAGLLAAWSVDDRGRTHEYVLYAHQTMVLPPAVGDAHRFATRLVGGSGGTWWEQVQLPAVAGRDHLDVLFAPAYTAPLFGRTPFVVAIHDLSFAAHPEWFGAREGLRRRWLSQRAAVAARAVITISEFTRGELADRFRVPADRLHVIPPGIERRTPPVGTNRPPHVLYVGSIFNRRHVPDLIRAFALVARNYADAELDIVGDNRSYPRQDIDALVAREGLGRRVRWRAYVPEAELGGLYDSARAFAFLSDYEGLGLTPLEALAAGVPPVLADTSVARESCGPAALYVGATDLTAISHGLERLLFDEQARAAVLAAAPGVLARYDWATAASATLQVLEAAGGSGVPTR
jgi:glycosyltransferase involved in cell wall biosynthesis